MSDHTRRDRLIALVLEELARVARESERPHPGPFDVSSRLIGGRAVVDSVGLIDLIHSVERSLEQEFGTSLDLTLPSVLTATRSPFMTVGTLAEHADLLLSSG